jgi:ferredoxin
MNYGDSIKSGRTRRASENLALLGDERMRLFSGQKCGCKGEETPYFPAFHDPLFVFYHPSLMADIENRYPENTSGSFYVDDQCIDCDLCRETAPSNFTRNDDGGYSFVYKQPENDDERALCEEAMEGCPVEAIGNDG